MRYIPALLALLLLASCHSAPKHARLIPKDALLVVGLHTNELRKDIAWSAVTGSSLLDEMKKAGAGSKMPEMIKDLDNAGIDFNSTLYFYTKGDNRYSSKMRAAAILPVDDPSKVAAYISKHLPGKTVRSGAKGIREVMPDSSSVIAWNDDVLIAMNSVSQVVQHSEPARVDTIGGAPVVGEPYSWTEYLPDEAATYAEAEAAFSLPKDADITGNARFQSLEEAGHDITMYLAYDAVMDMAGTSGSLGMMGMSLGNTLWKNAAMTVGLDFNKGAIDGTMRYYPADSIKGVAQAFSKDNIDPEMLRRLPATGLNMALGYHLTPAAVKTMLERLNLSGLANIALAEKGLSLDEVLGAFSGDITLSLNNFRTETKMQEVDSSMQELYGMKPYPITSPRLDYLVAFKTGDKAKMGRLVGFLTSSGIVSQTGQNTYAIPGTAEGPVLAVGDNFIAIGSTAAGAQGFLKEGTDAMPAPARDAIKGHPVGLWADVRSFINGAGEMAQGSPSDSAMYSVVRGMFRTFTMNGGEWKGGANEYKMRLLFQNEGESSLLQLLHMSQQIAAINGQSRVNPVP